MIKLEARQVYGFRNRTDQWTPITLCYHRARSRTPASPIKLDEPPIKLLKVHILFGVLSCQPRSRDQRVKSRDMRGHSCMERLSSVKSLLSVRALAVAAIVGGTILSASGPAAAAGLPSKAKVTGSATVTNTYSNGGQFMSMDALIATARETAEWAAKRQCESGEIRYKHSEVVNQSYENDKQAQKQTAVVTISTRCW